MTVLMMRKATLCVESVTYCPLRSAKRVLLFQYLLGDITQPKRYRGVFFGLRYSRWEITSKTAFSSGLFFGFFFSQGNGELERIPCEVIIF